LLDTVSVIVHHILMPNYTCFVNRPNPYLFTCQCTIYRFTWYSPVSYLVCSLQQLLNVLSL